MRNDNKLMYKRVTWYESWLVVVENFIIIDEIIDADKDQFLKNFRANG